MTMIARGMFYCRNIRSVCVFHQLTTCRNRSVSLVLPRVNQPFSTSRTSLLQTVFSQNGVGTVLNTYTRVPNPKHILGLPGYCGFHTSQTRHIHPVLWMLVKPLAKFTSLLTGRFLRKKWQKMDPNEKMQVKKGVWKYRATLVLLGALAVGAAVANYFMHLQSTPLTNRVRYVAFTREQLSKIADYEYEMHIENNKEKIVSHKHPVYNMVIGIAQRIVDANKDIEFFRDQTWTVWVIDDKEPNGFVLPNGHIFVYTGILKVAQTTDQLAVVLGHEMAHALLSHAAEQVSFAQFLDWFIILTLAALWFVIPSDGIALVTQWFYNKVISIMLHLPYSRKLELEADEVGLQLVAKACYDVRESATFWSVMQLITEHGSAEFVELPEWISTHPSNETRVENFNDLIPKAIDMRKYCKCKELPKKDPRDAIMTIKKVIVEEKTEPPEEAKVVPKGAKQGA